MTGSPLVPAARHQGRGAPCGESFWHWALGADGGHGHAQPPFRSSRLIGAERQPTSDCRQSLQQSRAEDSSGTISCMEWGLDHIGPVWGTRACPPRSGQEHLGLGSVSSDRILTVLSPGINVLSIHPRYWSFYSWVLDDFWSTDLPRTHKSFRDFYRPREALFSMACHVCDAPEHISLVSNIVGSRRVSPYAEATEVDPQFDYIKEPLGGYGLYYRSVMETVDALRIATPSNGLPFDVPTPTGQALAAAFRSAVGDTQVGVQLRSNDTSSLVS